MLQTPQSLRNAPRTARATGTSVFNLAMNAGVDRSMELTEKHAIASVSQGIGRVVFGECVSSEQPPLRQRARQQRHRLTLGASRTRGRETFTKKLGNRVMQHLDFVVCNVQRRTIHTLLSRLTWSAGVVTTTASTEKHAIASAKTQHGRAKVSGIACMANPRSIHQNAQEAFESKNLVRSA